MLKWNFHRIFEPDKYAEMEFSQNIISATADIWYMSSKLDLNKIIVSAVSIASFFNGEDTFSLMVQTSGIKCTPPIPIIIDRTEKLSKLQ